MARKNRLDTRKNYHAFLLKDEKDAEAKRKAKEEAKVEKESCMQISDDVVRLRFYSRCDCTGALGLNLKLPFRACRKT